MSTVSTPNYPVRETLHFAQDMSDQVKAYQHENQLRSKQEAYREIIAAGLKVKNRKKK